MGQENNFVVGNFSYSSEAEALAAFKEQEKIDKLEEKMDYSQPELVYSVYQKIMKGNMFHSPQGILYLVHLQEYLYSCEYDKVAGIPAIPADKLVSSGKFEGQKLKEKTKEEKNEEAEKDNLKIQENTDTEEAGQPGKASLHRRKDTGHHRNHTGKTGKRRQSKEINKKGSFGKNPEEELQVCRIIIFFLAAAIIIMLVIASRGDSPTILNYKKQIQNEYVEWQQQLSDKEEELRNRERELEQKELDLKEAGE